VSVTNTNMNEYDSCNRPIVSDTEGERVSVPVAEHTWIERLQVRWQVHWTLVTETPTWHRRPCIKKDTPHKSNK